MGVILPILAMLTVGWFYFSGDLYAANWNVHNLPFGEAATNAITMTLWSFLGLESACANADAVDNPEKSVPASVLCATALCAVIYIASTNVLFGMLPAADIEQSSASFGLAFAHMFGPLAGRVIMGMMTIACGGCLMGWQFTLPNIFKSMAREGFMPSAFAYTNRFGAPAKGMLILTLIQTAMAFMAISPNLNQQFEILVNLATIANLISYILSMSAVKNILITANKQKEMDSHSLPMRLAACTASMRRMRLVLRP